VESTPPSIVTVTEVMNVLQIDLMFCLAARRWA